ncbi:Yip1 family protein [Spirochaetota bacterium]
MSDIKSNIAKLLNDSLEVLIKPQSYFSTMERSGGVVEPVVKAVIYAAIAGVIKVIIEMAKPVKPFPLISDASLKVLFDTVTLSCMALVIIAVAIYFISKLCKGNKTFEPSFRVSASLMILYPINTVLGITIQFSKYAMPVISLAISFFGVWLIYNALVYALEADKSLARLISIFLAMLPILMLISSLFFHSGNTIPNSGP